MTKDFKIEGNTIVLPAAPKKPKKITGTRFAAILGLNPWQTPFQTWADMTGFYKEPFEETKYTVAGNVIEPKVIDYLDNRYYFGKKKLKTPEEWFGKTKQQMQFDHFHNEPVLGGMWDARTDDVVYELKTTKRVEDWFKDGKLSAPVYYELQGALYAYLCGIEKYRLVLTMLEEKDYDAPEGFIPTSHNTKIVTYKMDPNFQQHVSWVMEWYEKHVLTGRSPEFDRKKDEKVIKTIRTQTITEPADENIIHSIIAEMEPLQQKIDRLAELQEADEKRLKELKEQVKQEMKSCMRDTDKNIVVQGNYYSWELALENGGFDSARLKKEMPDIYNQFQKNEPKTVLRVKLKEAI